MDFLRFLVCFVRGHTPSGEFASGCGRTWQQCSYCGGWLGDMFRWRQ